MMDGLDLVLIVGTVIVLMLVALVATGRISSFTAKFKDWSFDVQGRKVNTSTSGPKESSQHLAGLLQRFERVMVAHGMRREHWQRFFEECKAPFSLKLSDLKDDETVLEWLDNEKIQWLCDTLLISRDWMDGEEGARPHECFNFNKAPERFLKELDAQFGRTRGLTLNAMPRAVFALNHVKKSLETDRNSRIFSAFGIPLCRLSNEVIVYRWIFDHALGGYPWHSEPYRGCLRIVTRLALVHFNMSVEGVCFEKKEFVALDNGELFFPEILQLPGKSHVDWHPDDYAYTKKESAVSKESETLVPLLDYMKEKNLPGWQENPIFKG